MKDTIKNLLQREIEAINNIPITDNFEKAVNLIYEQVHIKNSKLVCSGMGKAGQIALNIATTFSSTGTCAVYLHPSEAQHGDLGILRENDVLLLLSNSGKTREIVDLITLAGNLHPGIQIICITGKPESELAKGSDVCLSTGGSPEICPLGLTPTTSTTLMTIIGDMLVVTLMEKIGFTNEEYLKRHHSGYLSVKAKENIDKYNK